MIDVNSFLDMMDNKSPTVSIRFGKIPQDYNGGRPTVIIDGSTAPTVKAYPYIGSYKPVAGHRVMIVQGVIMGNIV
ncbi:hypothetical protein COO03_12025 [Bacillus sp. AFS098217]|uniref:hypothetical protein n=1 Tax=unclassified Bacillus (in: firmicutes) TaxID=185979 RepID=UPI000BEE7A11|nr:MULTISPECIES: hypothetical protein [unclassified Bacillus (in: firmicutes)]PEB52503.1 hypothetical protein COO03_12025 [Bacillus sp. AFS098217]PEU16776.1 hypothetical protein CN524_03350 [Bacillus sp. AFS019443]PEU20334.1 hypothetical protein CN525_04430 [Bacillus sp. AFS014408]PFW65276.1 hypothetical protein COL20_01165 [Bacillus sp. AFS075034]